MTSGPKYPHVRVPLMGHDNERNALMGRVTCAMRALGVPEAEVHEFASRAMGEQDYDGFMCAVLETVSISLWMAESRGENPCFTGTVRPRSLSRLTAVRASG